MNVERHMPTPPENRQFDLADCQFSTAEAAAHLRVSRSYLYELISAKKIHPVKIGKRTLIQGRELRRYMDALAAAV
jgi:excisionase family DNA binding protein